MATKARDEDWEDSDEPRRDARGRWAPGESGNRNGRPRKQPRRLRSLREEFAEELKKEVAIVDKGKPQTLTVGKLLVASVLRSALKAKPSEMFRILEGIAKLGAFEVIETESEEEPIFTDDDMRMLENIRQQLLEGGLLPPN